MVLVIPLLMNISNSTFLEGLNSSREANFKSSFSNNNIDDPYDYGNILALIGNGYFIKFSSAINFKILSLKIHRNILFDAVKYLNYDHRDQSCHMKDII